MITPPEAAKISVEHTWVATACVVVSHRVMLFVMAMVIGGLSTVGLQALPAEAAGQVVSSGDASSGIGALRLVDQMPFSLSDDRPEDIEKYRWVCYVSPCGRIAARRTDESRLFVFRHDDSSMHLLDVLHPSVEVAIRELRPSSLNVVYWDGAFHWRAGFSRWVRYSAASSEGASLEVPGPAAGSVDGNTVWFASSVKTGEEPAPKNWVEKHPVSPRGSGMHAIVGPHGWMINGLSGRDEVVNHVRYESDTPHVFGRVGAMDVSAEDELHIIERGDGLGRLWLVSSAGRIEGSLSLNADCTNPAAVKQLEAGLSGWSLIKDYNDRLWFANVKKGVFGRCGEVGFSASEFGAFFSAGDGRWVYGFKPAEARMYVFAVEMKE